MAGLSSWYLGALRLGGVVGQSVAVDGFAGRGVHGELSADGGVTVLGTPGQVPEG